MNDTSSRLRCLIRSRRILLALLAVLVLLAAAVGILSGCRIPANVTVGGIPAGELTLWEAWTAIGDAGAALRQKELRLTLPEESITVSPQELKCRVGTLRLLWTAWQAEPGTDIPLAAEYSRDAVAKRLDAYAARYDTVLTQPSYHLEGDAPELSTAAFDPDAPCQTLVLNPGTPECHLDVQELLHQVKALLDQGFAPGPLEITHTPPNTSLPRNLDLDAIAEAVCQDVVNDSLDLQTYQFVPGFYGYGFDREAAETALADAPWGKEIRVPMVITVPEILGDGVYFRDVLGYCETRHTDDENRNTNLRLVCQTLDGMILQPGEEFSYNAAVGERTAERGYKPAGAYSGTRLIQSIGGGVCQGSTTLYNCVLLADMEVVERVCHGFTVNYVPIGLDAAVNWATDTDFKFRNNWNFPIMIKAEVSDGYMKMTILGTDEKDYYVQMKSGYSEEELRIYAVSYKYKFDKETGIQISKTLEARSSYMYFS